MCRLSSSLEVYFFVAGGGVGVVPAGVVPAGAAVDGVTIGAAVPALPAAGVKGSDGAAVFGAAGMAAGGGLANVSSRTDLGAWARVDMICSMNASPRKMPAHHHVALVRIVPAWRIPMNASGEELAPPKFAARPLPFPACSRIVAMRISASRTRITSSVL